ncbi:8371_t:CDS:2 [Entrophospora sp. SA101]|nr:8371_t:CDS:2 [Entrophospora sp. SA101]
MEVNLNDEIREDDEESNNESNEQEIILMITPNEQNQENSHWLTNLPNHKLLKCLQHQKRNLSQDTSTRKSFPSVEKIREWAPAQIVSFLESGDDDLYLTNNDIEMIKKSGIAGEDFVLLKEEDLYCIGLSLGPAKRIERLTEGKYTIGNLEQLGTFDYDKSSYYFKHLQIDYGRLLTTVQHGHKLGGAPFLIGSQPPPNDSLWLRTKDQGFEMNVFDQDIKNHHEKEAHIELAMAAIETIMSNDPGILIIIGGDKDYGPIVKRALKCNWVVETWSWNLGVPISLKSDTNFYPLDNCYQSFSYGLGPDFTKKSKVLKITDGNFIRGLRNEDVLEWFITLKLFGWWEWGDDKAMRFYFNNLECLEMVKNWIESNFQVQTEN